jgi:signal transduction histidine kinase
LDVLWELTILRRVFLAVLREASEGVAEAVVVAARTMILDLLDLCARSSIEQHVQETEQERDAAAAKAASLEVQRQRFLGALSHELRNQIQPILFGLHRLKDSNPSAQQLRALEMIERQTRHQAFLLEDLLDLNRGRLGKIELKLSSVDLRECVRHGIEANQAEVNLKSLNVKLDLPGEPIYAFVDRERICQVATNLMSNAVKFTPNGGSIVWQVFQEPSWLVMCIRDTGRGIKADDLGNIFDIFFQGQAADAGQRGLGIGLTVVKNLVELHRGTIALIGQVIRDGSTATLFEPRSPITVRRASLRCTPFANIPAICVVSAQFAGENRKSKIVWRNGTDSKLSVPFVLASKTRKRPILAGSFLRAGTYSDQRG